MKRIKVRITFIEAVLGTWPSNQNIAREFIASKSHDANTIEDEVAALGADAVADKGMTVFPRNENGEPILYDYQIKGFFKDSCGMLSRIGGKTETGKKKAVNESGKLTAYKKVIDGLIFVQPRMIPIHVNGEITECQRPLRAQTAQGERVSLANSEQIPAGSTCEFEVMLLDDSHEKVVLEWLDYGALRGIGQWRNSSKGRFAYEILNQPLRQGGAVLHPAWNGDGIVTIGSEMLRQCLETKRLAQQRNGEARLRRAMALNGRVKQGLWMQGVALTSEGRA